MTIITHPDMRSIGLRTALTSVLVFLPIFTYAINPEKIYRYTPEDYNLEAIRMSVDTDDGATINIWHIPSSTKKAKASVLVAYSDAGNMAYWLSLAYYLNSLDYDIWLFDYRGFGESSDFEAIREMLFYNEYVTDLAEVPALYIRGLQDKVCSESEIPSSDASCVTFDCDHIMALSKFTNEYIS